MVVAVLTACGSGITKLEGEPAETKYYSLIVPQAWELAKHNTDEIFRIEKKLDNGTWATMTFYAYPDRSSEPADANSGNVRAGYTDKGDMTFGKTVYNVACKESAPTTNLYTKLTEKGLLLISVYGILTDDPEVKAIIENVTLK